MSQGRKKAYDYDEVMNMTNTGGEMDDLLTTLQDNLKSLRVKVNELEKLYHGKGAHSTIYRGYQVFYKAIGKGNEGMWSDVYNLHKLENMIYRNAKYDKITDTGE